MSKKTYNLQPTSYKLSNGFTLIELMVVVAIVGLLASAIGVSVSQAQKQSRDQQRIADLQNLSAALELYRSKYRYYPSNNSTSNGIVSTNPAQWSLAGLGFTPDYIQVLPKDPVNEGSYNYQYKTNGNVKVSAYELNARLEQDTETMANDVPESERGDDDYYEVGSGPQWWELLPL